MFVNSVYVWNDLQSCHQNVIFHHLSPNKLKEMLITFLLSIELLSTSTPLDSYHLTVCSFHYIYIVYTLP